MPQRSDQEECGARGENRTRDLRITRKQKHSMAHLVEQLLSCSATLSAYRHLPLKTTVFIPAQHANSTFVGLHVHRTSPDNRDHAKRCDALIGSDKRQVIFQGSSDNHAIKRV